MDDKKLEAFMTIVRTGSFCSAANEMGCTQSGLTQMVNSLEKELGCKLLERNYRGVTVSVAGRALMHDIEKAVSYCRAVKTKARNLERDDSVIRIGAFASIANGMLPLLLKNYRVVRPNTSFDIRVGNAEVPDWLNVGDIDIAFVDDSRKHGFSFTPLVQDNYIAVVPPEYPVASGDSINLLELMEHTFMMTQFNELRSQIEKMPNININDQITVSSADDTSLLSLVEQGLSVTVLTEMCMSGRSAKVKTYPLNPPMSRVIGAIIPANAKPAARDFVQFCKHYVPVGFKERSVVQTKMPPKI